MIYSAASSAFEAVVDGFATGLTGTIGVRLRDNAGADAIARTTAGIAEDIAGSGIYRVSLTAPATDGQYTIVWDNGSGVYATEELVVSGAAAPASAAGSLYVTRAQLKATLTMSAETFADPDIDTALSAAARGIDGVCHRRFYADSDAAQVRYFTPISKAIVRLDPDLATLTTLQTDPGGDGTYEITWTLNTDFTLHPINAAADSRPYEVIKTHPNGNYAFPNGVPRSVKITGKFGWPAVPSQIVDATSILAHKLLRRKREAPFGIVTAGIDTGVVMRIARNDPDVMFLIDTFIRGSGPSGGGFA